MVEAHVCVLYEQNDPNTETLRWSLSRKERCLCQGVVAPQQSTNNKKCQRIHDMVTLKDLWFTDDYIELSNRRNWNPATLDHLLDRHDCCMFFLLLIHIIL